MTPEAVNEAVRLLVAARRDRRPLAALPEACRPASPAEGYAVQRAFIAAWGDAVAGWKAGATALPIQQKFGLKEPFLGPIFKATVAQSPFVASAMDFEHRGIGAAKPAVALEVEFAFRAGRRIAPRPAGWSETEVLDAMDAMIPAFEIIAPRFTSVPFESPGSAIADCGVNGGIVLGTPVTDWRSIDYSAHRARHLIDGRVAAEGTGALVLGHPFKSLVWLVNRVGSLGFEIAAGEVLTTGSMTGIVYAEAGSRSVADFGRLGMVEIRLD
jgi:2-keto-4-pentenoate hydratase